MSQDIDMPISKKKLYPLLLLKEAKEVDGTTRFHKLMYILQQEYDLPIPQRFISYHYGPFSSELREDINFFVENKYIEKESTLLGENNEGFPIIKTTYHLSNKGKKLVDKAFPESKENAPVQEAVSNWNKRPLNQVIAHAKSLQ